MSNDGDKKKILVFSTDANLAILSRSNELFMDGTFSVSPHLFKQLFSIQVQYLGQMIPVVYALLPDKAQATYCRMFNIIRSLCNDRNLPFNPVSLQSDYEQAIIQAIRIVFPASRPRGCYFHYSQALWRQVCAFASYSLSFSHTHSLSIYLSLSLSLSHTQTHTHIHTYTHREKYVYEHFFLLAFCC